VLTLYLLQSAPSDSELSGLPYGSAKSPCWTIVGTTGADAEGRTPRRPPVPSLQVV